MDRVQLSDWAETALGLVFDINILSAGEMLSRLARFALPKE